MKKISISLLLVLSSCFIFSQSGAKWATAGNGVGIGDFLGTTNNFDLIFKTNNTQQMSLGTTGVLNISGLSGIGNRFLQTDANGNLISFPNGTASQVLYGNGVWGNLPSGASVWGVAGNNIFNTNSGNIGIGIANPAVKLDVFGSVNISANLTVGGGIITTGTVNSGGEVNGGNINVANKLIVGGNSTFNGSVRITTLSGTPDANVVVDANGNLRTITPSSGPCLPGSPLWHLGGDNIFPFVSTSINDGSIGTCDGVDFVLKSNNIKGIWLKTNGKIGFGIAVPTEQFHFSGGTIKIDGPAAALSDAFIINDAVGNVINFKVKTNGTAYAREIFVQVTPFPDYVFNNNYKLTPLLEVKSFTEKNHRLQNMPSAEEVKNKGANIGEIQRITVEKIEDIYLYLFEIKEELESMKQENKNLKKEIEILKDKK